jgi:hypothetical protein
LPVSVTIVVHIEGVKNDLFNFLRDMLRSNIENQIYNTVSLQYFMYVGHYLFCVNVSPDDDQCFIETCLRFKKKYNS